MKFFSGFGNHVATECLPGVLPEGRNSPQKVSKGLYAELLSGTSFTTPRALNKRSWLYRIRPSIVHPAFQEIRSSAVLTAPFEGIALSPNPLRWNPLELPMQPTLFLQGLHTLIATGNWMRQEGMAVHLYAFNQSMNHQCFCNFDGEMLILPEKGKLEIRTEMGRLQVGQLEMAVIPKGIKFQILTNEPARGYIAENYGAPLQLPELGPIGSNGLANARDFLAPHAWYEDLAKPFEVITKAQGKFWRTELDRSPFDVVGWHGNYYPYQYDLRKFNVIGSISFDHPDPSIYTVLTSPSSDPGVANLDFVIFAPRWLVQENTFRPPWFHRNIMSEYMGLIQGQYDAKIKGGGFVPGGGSLHNSFGGHGPDAAAFERASEMELQPQKLNDTMSFMFETRYPFQMSSFATRKGFLQDDYLDCWKDLKVKFKA